jgi:RNA polymerase sigma-B factor
MSRQRALGPGDRESLIESHLPLAKSVARRYVGRGVELDDLVQVAAVGLVKAANRFDVRRGASFHAFAEPTIEGEIRHHLRDRSGTVRIPRELQRLGERLRGQQSQLAARLGRAPTLSELADAVDADTKQVERALAAERAREPVTLVQAEDSTEDLSATEPYADSENRLLLTERMHVLDERERQIVYLRFHADMTERQIAHEVGISQAHVSRLLAAALTKLRGELAKDETPAKPGDTTVPGVVSPPPSAADAPGDKPVKPAAAGKPSGKPAAGYSGRFLVRMSGDLHQQLVQAAERRQVSLNRFVTESLAESVTGERPDAPRAAPAPGAEPPYPDEDRTTASHNPRRTLRMVLAANLVLVVVAGTIAVVLLVLALQQGL